MGIRRSPAIQCGWISLALALLALGCGEQRRQGAPPPVPVTIGEVVRKTMPISFRAIGHVEPIHSVAVRSRVGGELQRVLITEGREVRAGEVLFEIDPRPYRAALAQAQAVLERDRALLAKAQADAKRYAGLVAKDFVTKEEYDQLVATAESLAASVAADEAALEKARLELEYCTITAPVGGRTGSLTAKAGNLVKANDDTPLVTINQMRPIYVAFAVPSGRLREIVARGAAAIRVVAKIPDDVGPPSEGTLTFIDNAVDQGTGTILLRGTFANADERLWPGQFADIEVVLGSEPDRVVCPAPAVLAGQQGEYVFVVGGEGTVEQRRVTVARSDEREAVIASGLSGGESVVTDGQLRLVPGARVEVKATGGQGEPRT